MPTLEIVRAGAGSGKTTNLCETVAAAVRTGLDPSRILATTFTKKAAGELKSRIQSRLLSGGTVDAETAHRQADRLELACIGTVHSVAHQLLSRYAIPLGLSPRLRVLTEVASDRALSDLLGTMPVDTWQKLTVTAERLGVTEFRKRLLKLVAAKRGNRISDESFLDQVQQSADRVCQLLAPEGPAAQGPSKDRLIELIEAAFAGIEALNDGQKNTGEALDALRFLKTRGGSSWSDYLKAKKIAAGKRSGADAMLNDLRNHAADVCIHPELHADIRKFSSLLAEETVRLDALYEAYKRERGLVDFIDLEILFLDLLENEELGATIAADFDLVLVDEFQDTSPLQLAIFQRLRKIAPRSRWVGDPKQAIYGFRDTDPELVNNVWKLVPAAQRVELPYNYRSQAGLVQIVGKLFSPVFGEEAVQQPRNEAKNGGVERWFLNCKKQEDDAIAIACGVAKLHADGIRFGDIAVLERKNAALELLSQAFDALRIPYLLNSPGLLSTREGTMILAGLRLVADRDDSLAAATVLHLLGDPAETTPSWLAERLNAIRVAKAAGNGKWEIAWAGDPRFAAIERIDRRLLSPLLITQQVVEALGLLPLIAKWGDPARRCSNIDSILRHASEYEDIASETGEATTVNGLILYLEHLAANEKDMRFPPLGHDAVTLTTYHSAKGLEWPVVVLSGLHKEKDPEMWSPAVTGGNSGEGDPLEGRILRAWTWPFGYTEGQFTGLVKGSGLEDAALTCEEGVEVCERAEQESLRLLYVGCTRAKDKLVFAHRPGQYDWLSRLGEIDTLLPPGLGEGEHELEGINTSFVIRELSPDMVADCVIPAAATVRWLCDTDGAATEPMARYHYPSRLPAAKLQDGWPVQQMNGESYSPKGAKEEQAAALGNGVHRYLAALPSMASLGAEQKQVVAERCLAGASVTGLLPPTTVVAIGERLQSWIDATYPCATWATEVSVTGPRGDGGQWIGTIDLVLTLENGELVIVDHKSAPIRREQAAAKASEFGAQLAAYREVLQGAGEQVAAAHIHFSLSGAIVHLPDP